MVKLGTFSMTSYTLGHLFQKLIFIHITEFSVCINHQKLHILTFSHKLKSEKQTIFLVGAIKQEYICHLNKSFRSILSEYPKTRNI